MRRYGFTLVELLVSIVLIGLISAFAASLIFQTKQDNRVFQKQLLGDKQTESIDDILYKDIFQSKDIKSTNNKRYNILYIKSRNSIHGIEEPYIAWLVVKKDKTLIRLESSREITLPIKEDYKRYIYLDEVAKGCKNFSVNISKDTKSVLYFIEIEGKKPILSEIKKI